MMEIKKNTIIRTLVLVIALMNQMLVAMGKSPLPFSDEQITQAISTAFTIAVSLWAWWKNNSFTKPAIRADEVKDKFNKELVDVEDDHPPYRKDK